MALPETRKKTFFINQEKGNEALIEGQADMRIHHLAIRQPHLHAQEVKQFLNTQNALHKASPYSPIAAAKRKYYNGLWEDGKGVSILSIVGGKNDPIEEQKLSITTILDAVDCNIQRSINFKKLDLDSISQEVFGTFENQSLYTLNFEKCTLNGKVLERAIGVSPTLQVKNLKVNGCTFTDLDPELFTTAMELNFHIQHVEFKGIPLSEEQRERLTTAIERNQWLAKIQEENPDDILKLRTENMTPMKLNAITYLIEQERYRKIEIPQANPSKDIVESWLVAARGNKNFNKLVYNEQGLDKELTQKLQRQININRGVRKIFGTGNPLLARSAFMYGFMGFNFFQAFAAAIFPPYALIAGALGAVVVGGSRILSNAIFYRNLNKTKEAAYWEEPAHQEAYIAGRESAKSWAPWFSFKAWSTPGYLGYIQEKKHMESAVSFIPAPEPTAQEDAPKLSLNT